MSFLSTRDSLSERKCAIDDFAVTVQRLCSHQYKKALLFVDNAGSDVILGADSILTLHMIRELLHDVCSFEVNVVKHALHTNVEAFLVKVLLKRGVSVAGPYWTS